MVLPVVPMNPKKTWASLSHTNNVAWAKRRHEYLAAVEMQWASDDWRLMRIDRYVPISELSPFHSFLYALRRVSAMRD